MDWDKKIYPKDVWKWIKEHLPYWPYDITGGLIHTFKKYMKGAKAHRRKGGFTPRRAVSRIDRGYFDSDDFFDTLRAKKESNNDIWDTRK